MSEIHDRDVWGLDRRAIVAACLHDEHDGVLLAIDGWRFERFGRNGEMASIPYLRATRDGTTTEAPLRHWKWVQFEEDPR